MNWITTLSFLNKLMELPAGFTCQDLHKKVSVLGLTEKDVQKELDELIKGGVLKTTTEGYEIVH